MGFRKNPVPLPDPAKTESLLLKHRELFYRLFPNPLTQEQRLYIVDDSRRTLVIALVLAFNKAIERELSEKKKSSSQAAIAPKPTLSPG